MTRFAKKIILTTADVFFILCANLFAYVFVSIYVKLPSSFYFTVFGVTVISYLVYAHFFKLFSKIIRYVNLHEVFTLFICVSLAYITASVLLLISQIQMSWRFVILTYLFSLLFVEGSRLTWAFLTDIAYHKGVETTGQGQKDVRILLIGAGEGGNLFIQRLKKIRPEARIVGIVDDDPNKYHTWLHSIEVLGNVDNIPKIVKNYGIEELIVAIPSLPPKEFERILDISNPLEIPVKSMPSIEDIMTGELEVNPIRDVEVEDLLGREEVELDMHQIADQLNNKVILVTGAGGSIGSEICRQVSRFGPKQLLLLGHGENSIYLIEKELKSKYGKEIEIVPIIADVQDRERIFNVMNHYRPTAVYHAAAHKHVPLMEYNPTEAIKNNVFGTKNVAEAAKENGVKSFVMISTDKAVNPPNIMGATKRMAEMIVTGLNETGKTKFAAVRFGNVLGSRGSVIPLFKEQIKRGGPVTVTDFRMERYFMTIPEASRLVLQAGALSDGGEIFILDMGEPVKIVDLAKKIVKLSGYTEEQIPIIETGIRPGEKLREVLMLDSETTSKKVHDKIFVGKVNNEPYAEVVNFAETLLTEDLIDLKQDLIAFANKGKDVTAEKEGA